MTMYIYTQRRCFDRERERLFERERKIISREVVSRKKERKSELVHGNSAVTSRGETLTLYRFLSTSEQNIRILSMSKALARSSADHPKPFTTEHPHRMRSILNDKKDEKRV